MANLKLRGVRESINDPGPSYGPGQPMDLGATTIPNTPYRGCVEKGPSSAPCVQPNSSLGAKRMHHNRPGKKALGG